MWSSSCLETLKTSKNYVRILPFTPDCLWRRERRLPALAWPLPPTGCKYDTRGGAWRVERPPARRIPSCSHYAQGPRSPLREKEEKSQLQICHPFTAERSHYKRRLVLCRRRLISLSGVGTYTKWNLIRSNKRAGSLAAGGKGSLAFSTRLSHTPARSKFQSRNSKITAGTADARTE